MNVQVYQIDCKVYLLRDVSLEWILFEISSFIDLGLGKDEQMLAFHNKRGYKQYVHSGFREIERDKSIYKEGGIYSFSIRTTNEKLRDYFLKTLRDTSSPTMKGLVTTVKLIPKIYIEKLYSLTPAIIKLDQGYWKGKIDFAVYEERLKANAMKKAKIVLGEDFDEDFVLYNRIAMLNRTPTKSKFKGGITLLGDKLELDIADNKMAQQVAYILLGTGIHEVNARGFGFVNYKSGL